MKRLFWPAIETLAVILLMAGLIAACRVVFSSRFEAHIASIRAKGEPVTVRDLVGDPIPDDENAAIAYMQLSTEVESGNYDQALKTIVEFPASPDPYLGADIWAKAEKALAKTGPLRRLIDDAASRPKCRFDPQKADPLAYLFPHLVAMRRTHHVLKVSALANARNGRMEHAIEDIGTQIKVVQSFRNEPFLINHIMMTYMLSLTTKNLQGVAGCGHLSENQARRLFDALGKVDLVASCRRGWQGERVCFICISQPEYLPYLTGTPEPSLERVLGGPGSSLYQQTVLRGDLAVYLRQVSARIDGAGLSYKEAEAQDC